MWNTPTERSHGGVKLRQTAGLRWKASIAGGKDHHTTRFQHTANLFHHLRGGHLESPCILRAQKPKETSYKGGQNNTVDGASKIIQADKRSSQGSLFCSHPSLQRLAQIVKGHRTGDDVKWPAIRKGWGINSNSPAAKTLRSSSCLDPLFLMLISLSYLPWRA